MLMTWTNIFTCKKEILYITQRLSTQIPYASFPCFWILNIFFGSYIIAFILRAIQIKETIKQTTLWWICKEDEIFTSFFFQIILESDCDEGNREWEVTST